MRPYSVRGNQKMLFTWQRRIQIIILIGLLSEYWCPSLPTTSACCCSSYCPGFSAFSLKSKKCSPSSSQFKLMSSFGADSLILKPRTMNTGSRFRFCLSAWESAGCRSLSRTALNTYVSAHQTLNRDLLRRLKGTRVLLILLSHTTVEINDAVCISNIQRYLLQCVCVWPCQRTTAWKGKHWKLNV